MLDRLGLRSVVATAALVLLFSGSAGAQEGPRPAECPIAVPDSLEVTCGELVVPENHDEPGARQVRLPYIILRSRNTDPAPDPVVFTAGGPGFSSLDSVWRFAESHLLDDRDVIVFEQRGNRHAEPALMCDRSVWWEERPGHTPCLDRILASGIDITQYTTQNIARDVVALRQSLGYEQWNLYGSSFSTSVMLLVMESDPGGTRSAILQSVKPPNETTFAHEADSPLRAIEQVFTDCAADDDCAASYPNLAGNFHETVERLNEEPIDIQIRGSLDAEPVSITFDGDRLVDWVAIDQLYRPVFGHHDAAYLPLLVDEVHRGNLEPLEITAQGFWTSAIENPNWAWGLMFAINCQQDLPAAGPVRPPADLAASDRLDGFARSGSQRRICEAWDLTPLAPAASHDVESDRPALVLAGSYDPVTPPSWSRGTAEHLPNSTFVEFPGHGHDVNSDNPCAASLEARFVADPAAELDTSCVETAPQPAFILRDDVYRAPGLARSRQEVSLGAPGGVAWVEAVAAIGAFGSLLLIPVLVVLGLVWLLWLRHRSRTSADRTAVLAYTLATLATVATLAVVLLVDQTTEAYATRSELAYALGPSRDLVSARLLAWIGPAAGLVSLALAAVAAWAWLARRWTTGFRLLTTTSALCTLTIIVLGARWDLFTMLL